MVRLLPEPWVCQTMPAFLSFFVALTVEVRAFWTALYCWYWAIFLEILRLPSFFSFSASKTTKCLTKSNKVSGLSIPFRRTSIWGVVEDCFLVLMVFQRAKRSSLEVK